MSQISITEQAEIQIKKIAGGVFKYRSRQLFEMAWILEGNGSHTGNGYDYRYSSRRLFMMQSGEQYTFVAEKPTTIAFLKFSPAFIDQVRFENERIETCDNLKKINYILNHYHAKAGNIFRDKNDHHMAGALLDTIMREYDQKGYGHALIIRQSLSILINLIARNLINSEGPGVTDGSTQPLVMQVVSYLQQNIGDPEALKMEALAAQFNISPNYLGEYFKKHTGSSLQDYLVEYRIKLVETRLAYSNMRLKEIALELSFTDESYLSRVFRKQRGMSPGAYRKLHKQ